MGRKVILQQTQSPGDILSMSRAIADLHMSYPDYQIDVESPAPDLWEHNPHLTNLNKDDPDVEVFDIRYPGIHESGWRGHHFADAFREDIEEKLGVNIKKTSIRPEIFLSDQEKGWINQVEAEFGWAGPFWVLNAGCKPDNELKQYHRWQEVVDLFNKYFKGKVKIAQIGHKDHNHPTLSGIYDLIGRTNMRQLIRLCWWAHGTIGPLSFQFVLSAAMEQPHVVVAAGKEGVRWHIYPHGRYIYTNGAIDCCKWDGCWRGGGKGKCLNLVDDVPKCFRLIEPYQIVDAVKMYYEGGRLDVNKRDMHWC